MNSFSCSSSNAAATAASPVARNASIVDLHGDLKALPVVAAVHLVGHDLLGTRDVLAVEGDAGAVGELAQCGVDLVVGRLAESAHAASRRLVAEPRRGVSVRAQDPRRRRNDHRPGAHEAGERVGVHGARAAERDQAEVPRVVALLDRHPAQRPEHGLVGDVQDAARRPVEVEPEGVRDGPDRAGRRVQVQLHLSGQHHVREVPEDRVRIGDRRPLAPLAVHRGAWVGAGALRPDAQGPGDPRNVGDRAAPRAHGAHVQRGGAHGDVPHRGFAPGPRRAVLD